MNFNDILKMPGNKAKEAMGGSTPSPIGWEESFKAIENKHYVGVLRNYLNSEQISDIKSFISQTFSQEREVTTQTADIAYDNGYHDAQEKFLKMLEMMKQTSPNHLKVELVHNSGEKQKMYFNKGYNQALKDISYTLQHEK